MKYTINFHKQASEDFQESKDWYAEISEKLAERFESSVHSAIGIIAEAPSQFKKNSKNYHLYSLKKFPFLIVYKVYGETILIYAIYHHKRNPKKKYRKK